MTEVIDYCIKNDANRPDFEQDCVADGSIRPSATGPEAVPKHPKEVEALEQKMATYYKENWHRALLSLLGYKKPYIASLENYTLISLKTSPIYFHIDFLKPGKTTYIIEHREQERI